MLMQSMVEAGLVDTVEDKLSTHYWQVHLSNGETVVQEDSKGSAWLKLAQYLQNNTGVKIDRFGLIFRDNSYYTPDNQHSYYFSMGILATPAGEAHYYVMGWQQDDDSCVQCVTIKVPDLVPLTNYQKPVKECYAPALIYNR